jgi:hypothetical protein
MKVPSYALAPPISCRPAENREKPQRHSLQWYHPESLRKKQIKNSVSTGKVMITVFGDCGGVILGDARDNQPRRIHQDAERTQEAFQTSSASYESNIHLASVIAEGGGNKAGKNYRGPNMLRIF